MRTLSKRLPVKGRGYDLSYKPCGPLMCNMFSLICEKSDDAVIVDPSTHDPGEFDGLVSHLEGKEVKHILLTHGHSDHVSGVADAISTWPNAKLHLHPLEEENYSLAREQGRQFGLRVPTLPEPTNMLNDGDVLEVGETIKLKVVHTPGHAPGHVAFVDDRCTTNTTTEEDGTSPINTGAVVIGGDLLFRGSVGRTDFFNSSMEDLLASIRRLYEELDEDSMVLSGHTTATDLKTERESNPFVMMALQRPKDWYDEAKERNGWK